MGFASMTISDGDDSSAELNEWLAALDQRC